MGFKSISKPSGLIPELYIRSDVFHKVLFIICLLSYIQNALKDSYQAETNPTLYLVSLKSIVKSQIH